MADPVCVEAEDDTMFAHIVSPQLLQALTTRQNSILFTTDQLQSIFKFGPDVPIPFSSDPLPVTQLLHFQLTELDQSQKKRPMYLKDPQPPSTAPEPVSTVNQQERPIDTIMRRKLYNAMRLSPLVLSHKVEEAHFIDWRDIPGYILGLDFTQHKSHVEAVNSSLWMTLHSSDQVMWLKGDSLKFEKFPGVSYEQFKVNKHTGSWSDAAILEFNNDANDAFRGLFTDLTTQCYKRVTILDVKVSQRDFGEYVCAKYKMPDGQLKTFVMRIDDGKVYLVTHFAHNSKVFVKAKVSVKRLAGGIDTVVEPSSFAVDFHSYSSMEQDAKISTDNVAASWFGGNNGEFDNPPRLSRGTPLSSSPTPIPRSSTTAVDKTVDHSGRWSASSSSSASSPTSFSANFNTSEQVAPSGNKGGFPPYVDNGSPVSDLELTPEEAAMFSADEQSESDGDEETPSSTVRKRMFRGDYNQY